MLWNYDEKNSIDFIIVNQKRHEFFEKMFIDENKMLYDLSDHCLLKATFKTYTIRNKQKSKLPTENEYYKVDGQDLKNKCIKNLEEDIKDIRLMKLKEFEQHIKLNTDKHLKSKYNQRRRRPDNVEIEEPIWMDNDIKKGIKNRIEKEKSNYRRNKREL